MVVKICKKCTLVFVALLIAFEIRSCQAIDKHSTIAVMDFGTRPGAVDAEINIDNAQYMVCDYLINRLVDNNCFVVMDKDTISERLKEQNLRITGLIDPVSAQKVGKMLRVKYLLYGNVCGVSVSDLTGKVMHLGNGLQVDVCTVKAHVVGRIMDVANGTIVMAAKGDGVSRSSHTEAGLGVHGVLKFGTTKVTQDSVHNALMKAAFAMADKLLALLDGGKPDGKKTKKLSKKFRV